MTKHNGLLLLLASLALAAPAHAEKAKRTPNEQLFRTLSLLTAKEAAAGSQFAMLEDVTCSWLKSKKGAPFRCTFRDDHGTRTISGDKAKGFYRAVRRVHKVVLNCSKVSCTFARPQIVKCEQSDDRKREVLCDVLPERKHKAKLSLPPPPLPPRRPLDLPGAPSEPGREASPAI